MNRRISSVLSFSRAYATRHPRPKPGTSERPPYHAPDPLLNNPNATTTNLNDENLTFIHRPPPSAPSPFSLTTNPVSPLLRAHQNVPGETLMPPQLRASKLSESFVLTEAQKAEMRELRRSDPKQWTRSALARKFGCPSWFIEYVAALPKSARKAARRERDAVHAANREKWSERHSMVKAIRLRKREFW
ncbi:hypothetical protein EYR40_009682 [Pleurotus pulmonarius]|nr:hypothetical protein EYR38_009226 [Pleurotus pulmonarius]KAF4591082.1 hypothetical protein EYR40_009682 [Pleurotus pulmonarius]